MARFITKVLGLSGCVLVLLGAIPVQADPFFVTVYGRTYKVDPRPPIHEVKDLKPQEVLQALPTDIAKGPGLRPSHEQVLADVEERTWIARNQLADELAASSFSGAGQYAGADVAALEPEPGMLIETPAEWEALDVPGLELALDTGHCLVTQEIEPAAAVRRLAAAGVGSPRADAEQLAAYVLEVGRGRLLLIDRIRPDQRDRITELVDRRAGRIPLQHLLGTAAFRHVEVAVGPGVFVPRPETELLAGWGIEQTAPGAVVADLCSGSGAIALAVADEAAPSRVLAVERSTAALGWLRRNTAANPLITVVEADVTRSQILTEWYGRIDVVLCNPPYVPDSTGVPPEVADHDPAEAVFGGADGLTVIRPLIALAAALLKPGGAVGIEHDDVHATAVPELLGADGRFLGVTAHQDLTGRPRYATARRR